MCVGAWAGLPQFRYQLQEQLSDSLSVSSKGFSKKKSLDFSLQKLPLPLQISFPLHLALMGADLKKTLAPSFIFQRRCQRPLEVTAVYGYTGCMGLNAPQGPLRCHMNTSGGMSSRKLGMFPEFQVLQTTGIRATPSLTAASGEGPWGLQALCGVYWNCLQSACPVQVFGTSTDGKLTPFTPSGLPFVAFQPCPFFVKGCPESVA